MAVDVVLCERKSQFNDFLDTPFLLHKNHSNWVPPLRMTTKRILNKKNPFFKNAEIQFWVAYRNKKPVGRIAGILNHHHNQYYQEKIAFWGYFESENSSQTTEALFSQVELWAQAQGMNALRGPMSPSINYECGLQISAFDSKPFIMMPQHPEYYKELLEQQGHEKIKDLQAWILNVQDSIIDSKKIEIIKALQKRHQVTIRPINMKKFKEEIKLIATIYNDAWCKNWGYLPLDVEESMYLASDLKSIIMPNFIYIAELAGEPCGFSMAIPDLNQALVKIPDGKLLPFNFLKLIWQVKMNKIINQARIPLLGVLQRFQHIPIGGMLYYEYLRQAKKTRCVSAELSWILEDNKTMQAGLKLLNASHYKTYRIYQKQMLDTL